MQKKQHILIVSYYFYPYADIGAKRMSELASYLQKKGHTITVITADRREGNIHSALMADLNGIDIIKTWDPPSLIDVLWKILKQFRKKGNKVETSATDKLTTAGAINMQRSNESVFFLKRYLFSLQSLFDAKKGWAFFSIINAMMLGFNKHFDIVITSSPYTVSHAVGLVLQLFYGSRWIMDLRDPLSQPEFRSAKSKTFLRSRLETIFERVIVKRSDKIICASPGIEKNLSNNIHASKKLSTILNGFDGDLAENAMQSKLSGLRLIYAGQLYLNRNPFPLINALKNLIARGEINAEKISLVFFGNCEKWNGIILKNYLQLEHMDTVVTINDQITSAELDNEIQKSDVLINFAQGQKNQIPAKTYEYMQKGKYSLVFTEPDSDTAILINTSKTGVILDETNTSQIEAVIKDLYIKKTQGEEIFVFNRDKVKCFSRDQQNEKFCSVLEEDNVCD